MTAVYSVDKLLRRAMRAQAIGQRAADIFEANLRAGFVYGAAPTCNLALLARTSGYRLSDVEDAVRTHQLVRLPAMRGSIYLMPHELVPHTLAISPPHDFRRSLVYAKVNPDDYDRLSVRIEALALEQPRTSAEFKAALMSEFSEEIDFRTIVGVMSRTGRLVRTVVRGGAKSQIFEYAVLSEWCDLPEALPSRAEAMQTLARFWLQANGPATAADFGWWTSTKLPEAKATLEAISTRTIHVDGIDGELYATDEILDELSQPSEPDDEAYLLPCWDAYMMAHKDRSRYLSDAARPYVVDRVGNVTHVILVQGRVAGIWDLDGTTLLYALFEPLTSEVIERAAARLAPIDRITALRRIDEPPLLNVPKGGLNAFLGPLRAFRQGKSGPSPLEDEG